MCPQHDEAHNLDRPGILAPDVRRFEMYSSMCPRSNLWTSKHSLYWILSATGNQCNSLKSCSHTVTRLEIQNGACRCLQDLLEWCQCGSWKTGQHGIAVVQTSAVTSLAVTSWPNGTYSEQMVKTCLCRPRNVRAHC